MKCIIVIRGVEADIYQYLRQDLRTQFLDRGLTIEELPVFVLLPGDEANIEIVWIDPAMELEHLKLINSQLKVANSDDYAELYDALKATHI